MEEINYYTILYIGEDIKTLRIIEHDADVKWGKLIEACNQIEIDADRVVQAAEDYAEAAHDCASQRAYITKNAEVLNDDCKRAVMQMIKGPHDAEKARSIYHRLANLKARTEAEDKKMLWDNVFDGAIDWLQDGATIVYKSAEEVAAAKSKAMAAVRALVLSNTL